MLPQRYGSPGAGFIGNPMERLLGPNYLEMEIIKYTEIAITFTQIGA